jgi:uncharacterized Zn-binding protein involved in type VI secretion
MAGGVTREGDLFGMGGIVFGNSASNVTVDGRPVALSGSMFTPHILCSFKSPQHCFGMVTSTVRGVVVNGIPPLTQGSKGTCGHTVSGGSSTVVIVG